MPKCSWLIWMISVLLAACLGQPSESDRPIQSPSGIVGDPAETDTECTNERLGRNACDIILAFEQDPGEAPFEPRFFEGRSLADGFFGTAEPPHRVWEHGSIPAPPEWRSAWRHKRTIRLWMREIDERWERVCGHREQPCWTDAQYGGSGLFSGEDLRSIHVAYRREASGQKRLLASSTTTALDFSYVDVYSVAYDPLTGALGTTENARKMALAGISAASYGYLTVDAGGSRFGDDVPSWRRDE